MAAAAGGMQLRSGYVVGTLPGAPEAALKPIFEEGVSLILKVIHI